MNRCVSALAACLLLLAGCDIVYLRQFDVAPAATATAISATDGEVVDVLRTYAAAHSLQCDGATALPISCRVESQNVYAFRSQAGVTVCFFEWQRGSSERRAEALVELLSRRFGRERVRDLPQKGLESGCVRPRPGASSEPVSAAAAA